MRISKTLLAAAAAATLAGVPALAVAAEKVDAAAITLPQPPAEMGQVVFYRPAGMGGAVACSIHENGEKISSLGGGRYFVLNTTPGRHEFTVKTEKTDALAIEVESGERQWVACKIKMGIMVGRPDIRPSSEEEFRTSKKFALVDDEDMGPAPGALRAAEVQAAGGSVQTASE